MLYELFLHFIFVVLKKKVTDEPDKTEDDVAVQEQEGNQSKIKRK